jgi:nucleoside-diphosphate-sugar epimerase
MKTKGTVLITGGAGYVGTSLIPQLLDKKYKVVVYDRLLWGGDPIIPFFRDINFSFIKGDVRDKAALAEAVKGADAIVHLASLVGFPACDANPKLADETGIGGTKNLAAVVSKSQHIIYASSGSNYGRVLDKICTEETPLKPITRYSRIKTAAEIILMEKTTCTALRPGTAFGISPRLRLDLLIHQLTMEGLRNKKIILYEGQMIRPFIHVHDFGRAFIHAIEHPKEMKNEVYNLGADSLNFTKRQIAEIVSKETGAKIVEDDSWQDPDKRHYQVSYKKLQSTGYKPTLSIEDGVKEIVRVFPSLRLPAPYSNAVEHF